MTRDRVEWESRLVKGSITILNPTYLPTNSQFLLGLANPLSSSFCSLRSRNCWQLD